MINKKKHHKTNPLAENRTGFKQFYWNFNRFLEKHLPEKLYPRSILIVIMPVILLQAIIAIVFMERHWNEITVKLSRSVAREITLLANIQDQYIKDPNIINILIQRGKKDLAFNITFTNINQLPKKQPEPLFSPLYYRLQTQLSKWIKKPFQLIINKEEKTVTIYVLLNDNLRMRIEAPQSRVYASNSYIFIIWMILSSLILIALALIFLKNQIRPIQQLAKAAREFNVDDIQKPGKYPIEFKPHGATEVRQAAEAFADMKKHIQNHIRQRTDMLVGVSHDLRTILTRFRLQLAFLNDQELQKNLVDDVKEMEFLIEEYISFFKSGKDETPKNIHIKKFIKEIITSVSKVGKPITLEHDENTPHIIHVKPKSLKRAVVNLIDNANTYGENIKLYVRMEKYSQEIKENTYLAIIIDDDGPGIQKENRDHAFEAFNRLENARQRKQSEGAGLGLSIAKNIARDHGGDIILETAPIGGLRAILLIPVNEGKIKINDHQSEPNRQD